MKKTTNDSTQISLFGLDDDLAEDSVAEAEEESGIIDLPMDWGEFYAEEEPVGSADGICAESISDALVLSLTARGKVDIEYISSITGSDYKTVISALKGAIYQNPETWEECFYKGWETAEEYLSGNLIQKRRAAERANALYPGWFRDNLVAIERVFPQAASAKDIYVTLGSPWVPTDIIDQFITHFLYLRGSPYEGTMHDELTGSWEIPYKAHYRHRVRSEETYGTLRMPALEILERTLNMKTVSVTEAVIGPDGKPTKRRIVNRTETVAAVEKQEKLIAEFQRWVWKDEERKARLEEIFEEKYGCIRRRVFDGSFLEFPTMSNAIRLYPYQKDAVARIIFTPNTLLAHDVGAGKTYVMVAAGMELRRMGLSRKNLYVVPNNIVGQWREIFSLMYPDAKVLCVQPGNFTPAQRERMKTEMRDGDYDGIIIAYSCFEQIPLSRAYYKSQLEEQREAIKKQLVKKNRATAKLERKRESVKKALEAINAAQESLEKIIYFDELGITRLFVDEAHNFKNVPVDTKVGVLGISSAGSKRCQEMLDKVRTVQKQNGGKGVVFATGTPITNSITDAFIMQQYLQSGELAMLDLQSFDSWIGMFAERVTEFEIDVDTNSYRLATRFSRFHNLPELTALLSSVADFHKPDLSAGIPDTDGYCDALIARTEEFSAYLANISRRADDVRNGRVKPKVDNMLKITTDGRKAALDYRLVDPSAQYTPQSKVAYCMQNVLKIYHRTMAERSAQLVFCDISTPKSGFNLYDELKWLLVQAGIPAREIAFVHEAESESRREALFAKVRRGDVRVLIGSTFKLGIGVNIQDKLIALHHLDVPWRPADMTQREGRILRQGNTNPRVYIFRYITEGSFDAYSWQLLETKARFISDLLSGAMSERSGADIDDIVLDYAEVKALAVGNPLVKMRVETANELSRLLVLQHSLVEARLRLEKELMELPAKKRNQAQLISQCLLDIGHYERWKEEHPIPETAQGRREEMEERRALREQIASALQDNVLETTERALLTYRGFELVLPANMTADKPYVRLHRAGRYFIELGDAEVGNLVRIDRFLDSLPDHLERLKTSLLRLEERETEICAELAKDESYLDRIEACRKKLALLDKRLEAKKK